MTDAAMPPRVSLVPIAGWRGEDGRIAQLCVWHQGFTLTSATPMSRDEIQGIVNTAAAQHGIRAEGENATTEYAIRYADPYDGSTITEPIGAGSVEGYQRQDWCVVISRTCSGWDEVKP